MFHSAYTLEFPTNRLGRLDFERFRWALYPQSRSTLAPLKPQARDMYYSVERKVVLMVRVENVL